MDQQDQLSPLDNDSNHDGQSSGPEKQLTLTRDTDFYWEPLVIQVEQALFKIPRERLTSNSHVFDTGAAFSGCDSEPEGWSDDNAVNLQGVSVEEFRCLLKELFPTPVGVPHAGKPKSHWLSVLRLATLYDFYELRELSLRELSEHSEFTNVDRLLNSIEYGVSRWLMEGCLGVISQDELTQQDEANLGQQMTIRLLRLREKYFRRGEDHDEDEIRTEFAGEFRATSFIEAAHDYTVLVPSTPPAD